MSNSNTRISRRKLLGRSATVTGAAALSGMAGLGLSEKSQAHAVEINAMGPTPQQIQQLLALPAEPVVMVNLLKFKEDGGAEEYAKYSAGVSLLLENLGAKILFSSTAAMCLIGDADWDSIALVEYPQPAALIQMSRSPEYAEIAGFRSAGLAGQVNYVVVQS